MRPQAPAPATDLLQILLEPYTYISANPGKEIRSKLIEAFDQWLRVPPADLEVITRIVRMLHNASLL
jgi:geranylgeranyl diphosphate synthase type 3